MSRFPIIALTTLFLLLPIQGLPVVADESDHPGAALPILLCPADGAPWSRDSISFPQPGDPDVTVTIEALCAGPDGPIDAPDPGTDCESDAYRRTGWRWTEPVNFALDTVTTQQAGFLSVPAARAAATAAAEAWDAQTAANLHGTTTTNVAVGGSPYVANGINQITFETFALAPTAVAVTSTFSRGEIAFESDARYNPIWAWTTSGSGGFDFQNVATHEVGHTFGLGHPSTTNANACLTMYAYVSPGATNARTLGDGDILGIKAIYGS